MCNKTKVVSEGHSDSVERPNVEHLDGFDREAHSTPVHAAFQNLKKRCKKLEKQTNALDAFDIRRHKQHSRPALPGFTAQKYKYKLII